MGGGGSLGLGYLVGSVGVVTCHFYLGTGGAAHGPQDQQLFAEVLDAVLVQIRGYQVYAWD